MSELFKEAVLEAKKLRQIAEEDATKSIVDSLAPYIKKAITQQINESSTLQEEDLSGAELGGETATQPEVIDSTPIDSLAPEMGDQANQAPVAPSGEELVNAMMPDEDGKVTVDFEELFPAAAETSLQTGAPIDVQPMPAAPEQPMVAAESVDYKKFVESLREVAEKIDHAFFAGPIGEARKNALLEDVLGLLRQLDSLQEGGKVGAKLAKLNDNKLEFLYQKLKEANLPNSYIEKDQKDQRDISMNSLKEYAAKLFEEEDSIQTSEIQSEGTTASGKHAADVSGVDPNVGGPEDLEAKAEDDPGDKEIKEEALPGSECHGEEKPWEEGEAPLDEEDQDKVIEEALDSLSEEVEAEGHAGFGDTDEEPPAEFEVDEAELKEAIDEIQKETISEASDGSEEESWEDAEPEGGDDPSHENLKEGYMAEEEGLEGPGDLDLELGDDDADGDLVLNIDLPDEVEDALANVDVSALDDVSVDLAAVNIGDGDEDHGGDDVPALVDDEPPVDLGDEPPMEDEGMKEEDWMREHKELKEANEKLAQEKEALEAELKEAKEKASGYKTDLKEANLFLAKNVYFTKFLQRGDLSRKNLEKIVEYLDRAETVAGAQKVYKQIKAKLVESANKNQTSKKLAGSSSQVTTPGSATALNESVNRDPNDQVVNTVSRWQHLAGIKNSD